MYETSDVKNATQDIGLKNNKQQEFMLNDQINNI
jgi:hypothetical protein